MTKGCVFGTSSKEKTRWYVFASLTSIIKWAIQWANSSQTNYGPSIHNRSPRCVRPCITPLTSCSPPLLFYPSDNRQLLVFDLWSGRLVKSLKGHFGRVGCVALRPWQEEVYSGGNDSEILCWSPPTDEKQIDLSGVGNEHDAWSDED